MNENNCFTDSNPPLLSQSSSEGKAMELFRKLREKPRGLTLTYTFFTLWLFGILFSTIPQMSFSGCKVNLHPVPLCLSSSFILPLLSGLRPAVFRRQPGGGAACGSGRAVLWEETQRLLHTPQVRHTLDAVFVVSPTCNTVYFHLPIQRILCHYPCAID